MQKLTTRLRRSRSRQPDLQLSEISIPNPRTRGYCHHRREPLGDSKAQSSCQSNPHHDYQPGWTVTGSGLAPKSDFRRPLDSLIPPHIAHIKENVKSFDPRGNSVSLEQGGSVGYDYLIVAAGLQLSGLPYDLGVGC